MPVSYVPTVIVKFRDDLVDTSKHDAADKFLDQLRTERAWIQLVARGEFKGITIEKLLTAVTQPRLLSLINDARLQDPTYHPPNFLAYFAVHCPTTETAEAVAHEFSLQPWDKMVQFAYVAGAPGDLPGIYQPVSDPGRNPDWVRRDTFFHRSAPAGIDSMYAWKRDGGEGAGTGLRMVDIESDWDLHHNDLPGGINVIHGDPRDYTVNGKRSKDHGCAVLGIVAAQDNTLLSLGITPHLPRIMVASMWRYDPAAINRWFFEPWNAIESAIDNLQAGDVLLLEIQIDRDGLVNLPVEYDEFNFRLIQEATALGIVVVEAAGNYWHDLDALGIPWLNRDSPQFEDSGAIMVSAATSWVLDPNGNLLDVHKPIIDTATSQRRHNYGNRIDCYAWGENIRTTRMLGETGADPNGGGDCGDTSGASAIIAGAALAIQGIRQARTTFRKRKGTRFPPKRLRDILSDPDTGTRSENYPDDKIGVMPDLRAIIDRIPDITPRKKTRKKKITLGLKKRRPRKGDPPNPYRRKKKTNPKAKKRKR